MDSMNNRTRNRDLSRVIAMIIIRDGLDEYLSAQEMDEILEGEVTA